MSGSVIGALRVVLGADTAAFEKGLDGAQRTLKKFSRDMQKLSSGFSQVGQALTLGVTAPILAFGVASISAAQQSADAFAQVEAALKSMGGASGRTAEQLQASAEKLQDMAAIDDDEILRKVTANLLTFGKIAGPTFDRAQVAVVDLATRMKMDLQAATILVGKALNDPVKGMVSLGRAGIQLTEDQKTLIKSLTDTGRTAEAQAIILGELERQFGGSAKAAADANPYARLTVALGKLSEAIGKQIVPILAPVVAKLTELAKSFSSLSPAMQKFIVIGGLVTAAIGPILIGIGMLISAVGTIAAFMAGPAVAGLVAFLAPLAPIIAAVAALVGVFLLFREQITPVLQAWGNTAAEVLGPKIAPLVEALKEAFSSFVALVAPLFQPGGALHAAMQFFLDVATRVFNGIVSTTATSIEVLTNILQALAALFRGDFSAMWGHLKDAAVAAVQGIGKAFAAMFPDVVSWVKKTWEGVKLWLVEKFTDVVNAVGEKVKAVAGFFKDLWDAVVGHSYVPDMVDGIRDEFARLDQVMVNPALKATQRVADAFARAQQKVGEGFDGMGLNAPGAMNDNTPQSKDNVGWGGRLFDQQQIDQMREQFVSFGRSFVDAVRTGRLEEFFADIANRFVDKLITDGLNKIFDAIGKTQSGGGWMQTIGSIFSSSSIPGFKTGGSFGVGGSGGPDSQLVRFWATPGEMVNISHGNDNGPRGGAISVHVEPSPYFDVRVRQISGEGDARVIGAGLADKRQSAQRQQYRARR